jgi:hypothetical protein
MPTAAAPTAAAPDRGSGVPTDPGPRRRGPAPHPASETPPGTFPSPTPCPMIVDGTPRGPGPKAADRAYPGRHDGVGRRARGASTRSRDDAAAPPIERLERYVLLVTPLQPLVDWVRGIEVRDGLEDGGPRFSLEEAEAYHRAAYLVPLAADAHAVEAWVEENFDLVFEQELHGYESDRRRWPRKRTLDRFLQWFDLELLDAPIDLVDAPLLDPTRGEGRGS